MPTPISFVLVVAVIGLGAFPVLADEKRAAQLDFFERRIRPVLVQHCYECHSAGSASIQGGLQLDSREGLRRGGDSGPSVVPEQADASPLLAALRYETLQMPPAGQLSPDVIVDFETWIRNGAVDPRDAPPSATESAEAAWKAKLAERSRWWSLQPPRRDVTVPALPLSSSDEPVDRFLEAELNAAGLRPARPAEPEVLLRRACFVLTGLPPEPHQVESFCVEWDRDPQTATERLVDELLASPHFGERFARHWMDVVHYTDTFGYEWDVPTKGAGEYRDYLIRAFNRDVGFDQLIREQIAGDLLPEPRIDSAAAVNESLIGPAFFHQGERRHGSSLDFNGVHQEMVDSQIDAFSKAFLGMTVACARCHDHKLDAISQRDYYALAGVFMTPRWTVRSIEIADWRSQPLAELKRLREDIRLALGGVWQQQLRRAPFDWGELALKARSDTLLESPGYALSRLLAAPAWLPPGGLQATAEQPATQLAIEADGVTVIASGTENPATDTYTITFQTPPGDVDLLQLQALTHPSLGTGGPGRAPHGNFVLSQIRVCVTPANTTETRDVTLASASADYEQPGFAAARSIDSSPEGWAVGLAGNVDRTAWFRFQQPVHLPAGGEWRVTLVCSYGTGHNLGRFRITPGFMGAPAGTSDHAVRERWAALAQEWTADRARRLEHNRQFTRIADFQQPGMPQEWVAEGPGMEHGWVPEATPLVALDGPQLIAGLLPRGYHTHALSSKLSGAVRLPDPTRFPRLFVSLQLSGGEWSGYRSIPQNAFLVEGPAYFNPAAGSSWIPFTRQPLKHGVTRILSEVHTASLNANFPGRVGIATMGPTVLPFADDGNFKRSWFSLTGAITHDSPGAPRDELDVLAALFDDDSPENYGQLQQRLLSWLSASVDRWTAGLAGPGDRVRLKWMLDRGLLTNDAGAAPEIAELVQKYRQIEASIPFPRTVVGMDERQVEPIDYRLNVRGDVHQEGPAVHRDFLEVFREGHGVAAAASSGRLELAEYLSSSRSPQTARVFVNRVWQWVFGTGLVETPNDFGKLGGRPSHPELLDWLSLQFVDEGWSTKRLVRRLVLSHAFRRGSDMDRASTEVDPGNRLLHHYPTRRLEAEAIRDSLLAVSGRLDRTLFGPPIRPHRSAEDASKRLYSGPMDGRGRRSIYQEMSVMQPPGFLVGFNLPDLKLPTGRRDVTNVPAQALILLNDPFVNQLADHWAERLLADGSRTPEERIRQMFLRAFGREPARSETERWKLAVMDCAERPADVMIDREAWKTLAHACFNSKEFLYYR